MSEEINLDEVAPAKKKRKRRTPAEMAAAKKKPVPKVQESAPALDPNESPESRKRKKIIAERKAHKKNTVTGKKYYTTRNGKLILIIEKASRDDPTKILRRYSRYVGRLSEKAVKEFIKKIQKEGKFRDGDTVRLELDAKREANLEIELAENEEEW